MMPIWLAVMLCAIAFFAGRALAYAHASREIRKIEREVTSLHDAIREVSNAQPPKP